MANEQVEQPAIQLRFISLQDLTSLIAVIDTVAQRSAFKGEEFSTVGRLRDLLIAETQEQGRILQEAKGEFGGASMEPSAPNLEDISESDTDEEDVPKANRKKK